MTSGVRSRIDSSRLRNARRSSVARRIREIVQQLDAHVVRQRVLGPLHLEGVGEVRLELHERAVREGLAGVAEVDLRQPRDARLDVAHALLEVGDGHRELLGQLGPLGPRADQAHLTHEHVDELGHLVEARPTQDAADPRDARVVLLGDDRSGVLLGVRRASTGTSASRTRGIVDAARRPTGLARATRSCPARRCRNEDGPRGLHVDREGDERAERQHDREPE